MDIIAHSTKYEIWQVLPRGMRFDIADATSIDLFVSEMAAASRFRPHVFAEHGANPLPAPGLTRLKGHAFASTFRRAEALRRAARGGPPDLVVVQQHLPFAAAVASRIARPIVLQKHNFTRPPSRKGMLSAIGEDRHLRQYARLAGITFVSNAVLRDFERDWPAVECPRIVVPNGIVPASWSPAAERDFDVLVVGRGTPEKGLLEAARGVVAAIADAPGWTTTFIVSESRRDPAYLTSLRNALAPLGERGRLFLDLPAPEVRALNERASIAVVPSVWREPFGRTCLEAHAGGAAVISSGTGGLREISGSYAIHLEAVSPTEIAGAVAGLINDPELRRALATAGRIRALRQFDVSRIAGTFDDFCASLLDKSRLRRLSPAVMESAVG